MAFAVSNKMSLRGAASKRMIAAKANTTKGNTTSGGAATITNIDFLKSLPGVSQPFPEVFDPANLSATASVKDIRRWRESELVHGRVAMLAALGFVVQENIEDNTAFFPFAGKITGPAIYHFQQIKQGFWEPLLLIIGIAEAYRVAVGWTPPVDGASFNALREDYDMGDLGFDPLGLKPKDPEALKDLQTKELNNGRLAMIAVAGFVGQELLFQHEVLTWGGFNQSLAVAPVDPSTIKPPPLPVEFPDRGVPNIKDIHLPTASDVKDAVNYSSGNNVPSLPSLPNISNITKSLNLDTPSSTPSLPDVGKAVESFTPPALNLDNVKQGLNFSAPSGGEIANKAQELTNSLPGGLPSGGEIANKAQELKNNLPSLPSLSGFKTGLVDGAEDIKNSLPSGQDVKNSLPGGLPSGGEIADKAQELKNSLPSLSAFKTGLVDGAENVKNSLPSGQDVKDTLPGGLPSGGEIANKAQELKNSLPSLPSVSGFKTGLLDGAEDIKNSLPSSQDVKNSLPSGLPSGGEIANKVQEVKNSLPSLPSLSGFKTGLVDGAEDVKDSLPSGQDVKDALPGGLSSGGEVANKVQELTNNLPSLPNPFSGSLPTSGEVANKAQEVKNSLPGGLPSGGEIANKAQELTNNLPSLPTLSGFKTGLVDGAQDIKDSLPSSQDVKEALPNVQDILNNIPDVPTPSVSVPDVRTPGQSF